MRTFKAAILTMTPEEFHRRKNLMKMREYNLQSGRTSRVGAGRPRLMSSDEEAELRRAKVMDIDPQRFGVLLSMIRNRGPKSPRSA